MTGPPQLVAEKPYADEAAQPPAPNSQPTRQGTPPTGGQPARDAPVPVHSKHRLWAQACE